MHVVVNRITLAKPIDDDLLAKIEGFFPRALASPGFINAQFVRVSDTELIGLVYFATREALDEISSKIAAPWFAEQIRPHLGGPVQRSVGEVIARAVK